MHSLVTTNELIGERETWHNTTLLQPEDGGERFRKEYSFDCCESNQPLGKHRTLIRNPSESPVGLVLDAGNGVHGVKEVLTLRGVLDVSIDEERVSLGMDIPTGCTYFVILYREEHESMSRFFQERFFTYGRMNDERPHEKDELTLWEVCLTEELCAEDVKFVLFRVRLVADGIGRD